MSNYFYAAFFFISGASDDDDEIRNPISFDDNERIDGSSRSKITQKPRPVRYNPHLDGAIVRDGKAVTRSPKSNRAIHNAVKNKPPIDKTIDHADKPKPQNTLRPPFSNNVRSRVVTEKPAPKKTRRIMKKPSKATRHTPSDHRNKKVEEKPKPKTHNTIDSNDGMEKPKRRSSWMKPIEFKQRYTKPPIERFLPNTPKPKKFDRSSGFDVGRPEEEAPNNPERPKYVNDGKGENEEDKHKRRNNVDKPSGASVGRVRKKVNTIPKPRTNFDRSSDVNYGRRKKERIKPKQRANWMKQPINQVTKQRKPPGHEVTDKVVKPTDIKDKGGYRVMGYLRDLEKRTKEEEARTKEAKGSKVPRDGKGDMWWRQMMRSL